MAWKAKTLAKTLMTVALEITFGILSAMIDRFGYPKANIVLCSPLRTSPRTLYRRRSQHSKRGAVPRRNDQFSTPPHPFGGSIDLSGLSFLALSSKTSVVSG